MNNPYYALDGDVLGNPEGIAVKVRYADGGGNHLLAVKIADLLNADHAATLAARQPKPKAKAA